MKEKTLEEVLRENKTKMMKKNIKRIKAQEKKENVLAVIVGSFIIISTIVLLVVLNRQSEKDFNSCLQHHSLYYCEQGY